MSKKYTLEEILEVVDTELATPDGERFTMLQLTRHILIALIDKDKPHIKKEDT